MKKNIILIFITLIAAGALFAQENEKSKDSVGSFDVILGGGVTTNIFAKVYAGENVGVRYTFDNGISLQASVKAEENIIRNKTEPVLFISPLFDFGFKGFYIGGGPLFFKSGDNSISTTFLARTGWEWGKWTLNDGTRIKIRTGIEESPRMMNLADNSEDNSDATVALGAVFGTLFSLIPTIDIGVSFYLPI